MIWLYVYLAIRVLAVVSFVDVVRQYRVAYRDGETNRDKVIKNFGYSLAFYVLTFVPAVGDVLLLLEQLSDRESITRRTWRAVFNWDAMLKVFVAGSDAGAFWAVTSFLVALMGFVVVPSATFLYLNSETSDQIQETTAPLYGELYHVTCTISPNVVSCALDDSTPGATPAPLRDNQYGVTCVTVKTGAFCALDANKP
jgi:hypothetical protein